jgi:nitrate reductase alpha subunit
VKEGPVSWIQDILNARARQWEDVYRNRWQYDRAVRSTHGVNCTGGCSWMVYVKDGIVTWEMQATDYPRLAADLPPYEPRGCQRGISFSWYIYSPIRVKYPYLRGTLMDLWRVARMTEADPVAAWASIVESEASRRSYQQARGKGGFRRSTWGEVLEIIAASILYTARKYGPDRVIGFSPIPAMSMLSYASGVRFLELLDGVALSFYDWYSDLPPASPEVWGEQTDVCESADWYHSKYVVVMGSNLNMTRTPDVHFVAEGRHDGSKLVVLSPDFSQVSKYADWWIPIQAGEDAAFWLAVNHVILQEFHHGRSTPHFLDYTRRFTDAPFLIVLEEQGEGYVPGRLLRAGQVARYSSVPNAGWKYLVMTPLQHDTRAEMAQDQVRDWARGECPPVPGVTMPHLAVVERDYVNLYNRYISLGPRARHDGLGTHGVRWPIDDLYDDLQRDGPAVHWGGSSYPSLADARDVVRGIGRDAI